MDMDMVRRLLNTKEELGAINKGAIVDQKAGKLLRSGFNWEQTKMIILNGIKSYEAKRKSRMKKTGMVHNSAKMSQGSRWRKKILSKSNWFKKRSKKEQYDAGKGSKRKENTSEFSPEVKSVLFCEYTPDGELAGELRELMKRLENTLGFTIKVVERTGRPLKSQFPLDNLGEGAACGRQDCTTCTQGAETIHKEAPGAGPYGGGAAKVYNEGGQTL